MFLAYKPLTSLFLCLFQYPGRGYHSWGRPLAPHPQALWGRRSSWNSLGGGHPCSSSSPSSSPAFTLTSPRPIYGYGLAGVGGVVGGSLRIRGPRASSSPHRRHALKDEEESLLSPPLVAHHPLHLPHPSLPGHFGPRRDRRALSLELPHVPHAPPHPPRPPHHPHHPVTFREHPKKKNFSVGTAISGGGRGELGSLGGLGGVHQDCNGRTPQSQLLQPPQRHQAEQVGGANHQSQLLAEVFPQVNTRSKDREDLDDETDYVSGYTACADGREFKCDIV